MASWAGSSTEISVKMPSWAGPSIEIPVKKPSWAGSGTEIPAFVNRWPSTDWLIGNRVQKLSHLFKVERDKKIFSSHPFAGHNITTCCSWFCSRWTAGSTVPAQDSLEWSPGDLWILREKTPAKGKKKKKRNQESTFFCKLYRPCHREMQSFKKKLKICMNIITTWWDRNFQAWREDSVVGKKKKTRPRKKK